MSIPPLKFLSAQAYLDFFLSFKECTPSSPPFSPTPSSKTEPPPLSSERISKKQGDLLRGLIDELRARRLANQEPTKNPPLPEEVVDIVEAVLLLEELTTEEIKNSPPSALSQKARILFYFLNTCSKEKERLLEIFERERTQRTFQSVFHENIEILFSDLFLNLPFNEIRILWKAALGLTKEKFSTSSGERQHSPEEKMIEAYAGKALYRALEKRPSLLTSSQIDELTKKYPTLREDLDAKEKTLILRVLSCTSSTKTIAAFQGVYANLAVGLHSLNQYPALLSLARNRSAATIKAFGAAYPFGEGLSESLQLQVVENLIQNDSAEAIIAFQKTFPKFTEDFDEEQQYHFLVHLAREGSAKAITAFHSIYPQLSTRLTDAKRYLLLENLARNRSPEAITVFNTEYLSPSVPLTKQQQYYVLLRLAHNTSAVAITAFGIAYSDLLVGLDKSQQDPLWRCLAQNTSVEAIRAFKAAYSEEKETEL